MGGLPGAFLTMPPPLPLPLPAYAALSDGSLNKSLLPIPAAAAAEVSSIPVAPSPAKFEPLIPNCNAIFYSAYR